MERSIIVGCRKVLLCSINTSLGVFHSQKAVSRILSALSAPSTNIVYSIWFLFSHLASHPDASSYITSLPQTSATIYPSITHLTPIMASIARRLSAKHLTRDLRELGFEKKLVRKFVETPDSVEHATVLLKSYSPPSRKPRKGRYNDLCLRKGSRNQRELALEHQRSCLVHTDTTQSGWFTTHSSTSHSSKRIPSCSL
jgi:hypothetical protein